MDVEARVIHHKFGLGTVIEMVFTAGGNLPAARISFDDGSERVLLLSALTLSDAPGPAPAKKTTRRRKAASSRTEPISDQLLVPELDEVLLRPSDGVLEEYEEA